MSRLQTYLNLLLRIGPRFNSVDEGKNQPIDPNIGYFSFVVFEPGWYRCYRVSTDRSGTRVVNEDNPIAVYSITQALRNAEIELGRTAIKERGLDIL